MNYQTVRLVSTFGSGSCVSTFGLTQKWKVRTRFQFWAVSTFGSAQSPKKKTFINLLDRNRSNSNKILEGRKSGNFEISSVLFMCLGHMLSEKPVGLSLPESPLCLHSWLTVARLPPNILSASATSRIT